MNAVLLTGDMGYLDIPRGQIDYLVNLGRMEDGQLLVPYRHSDDGWTSYRPLEPQHIAQIWYMSQSDKDRQAIEQFPQVQTTWLDVAPGSAKGDNIHFGPWYCYLDGRNPDYPRLILESQYAEVLRRLDKMRNDYRRSAGVGRAPLAGHQPGTHGSAGPTHLRRPPGRSTTAACCMPACAITTLTARRPGLPPDVGALVTESGCR